MSRLRSAPLSSSSNTASRLMFSGGDDKLSVAEGGQVKCNRQYGCVRMAVVVCVGGDLITESGVSLIDKHNDNEWEKMEEEVGEDCRVDRIAGGREVIRDILPCNSATSMGQRPHTSVIESTLSSTLVR